MACSEYNVFGGDIYLVALKVRVKRRSCETAQSQRHTFSPLQEWSLAK